MNHTLPVGVLLLTVWRGTIRAQLEAALADRDGVSRRLS